MTLGSEQVEFLSDEFADRVLAWVKGNVEATAEAPVIVTPCGTDWAGSTEEGFFSRFTVDISYATATGRSFFTCEGEHLQKLWEAVVR